MVVMDRGLQPGQPSGRKGEIPGAACVPVLAHSDGKLNLCCWVAPVRSCYIQAWIARSSGTSTLVNLLTFPCFMSSAGGEDSRREIREMDGMCGRLRLPLGLQPSKEGLQW